MSIKTPDRSGLAIASALALAFVAIACSGGVRETAQHPATFESAMALAAEKSLPLLVDFYSPT